MRRWNSRWVLLAGLLWVLPAAAEIYKWVDAEGQVHYGQRPAGNDAQEMNVKQPEAQEPAAGPSMEERRAKQQRLLDSFKRKHAREKAAKQAEKERQAKQHRLCLEAKDRLKGYRQAQYLYRLDQNGKRVPLSDAERAAQTQALEQKVKKNCR